MTRITWGNAGGRFYEGGIDRGVLYVEGAYGVPWNGIVQVSEKPTGSDATAYYLDGQKYYTGLSSEEFAATLEAYYSPQEFDVCDGSASLGLGLYARQQPRQSFGLSYRTKIGNDLVGLDYGYKLHIIYNALAAPSTKNFKSLSSSIDLETLSWDLTTKAVAVPGAAPTAHMVIDMSEAHAELRDAVEAILYGTDDDPPRLPTPDELIELFASTQYLLVTDNGDGTATISGPDDVVYASIDPSLVLPEVPEFHPETNTVTIPTTTGVVYTVDGTAVTGDITVTDDTIIDAEAAEGYRFPDGLDQYEVYPSSDILDNDIVWTITYPSVVAIAADTYQVSSL